MALIQVSKELVESDQLNFKKVMRLIMELPNARELRYLRSPQDYWYYVEVDKYGPSDQICPDFHEDEEGEVTMIIKN